MVATQKDLHPWSGFPADHWILPGTKGAGWIKWWTSLKVDKFEQKNRTALENASQRKHRSRHTEAPVLQLEKSERKHQFLLEQATAQGSSQTQPIKKRHLRYQEIDLQPARQDQRSSHSLQFYLYLSRNTAKIFFKKPSREYYVSPKHKNNSYIVDRQPMPRSSYSAQYLNYGNISTYSYKPDITPTFPEASLAVKASTYQQ